MPPHRTGGSRISRSIAIAFFSDSGNTDIVTGFLAKALAGSGPVDSFCIEDMLERRAIHDPWRYSMLGIGYPIHGFEPPAVVHDFIKRLGESEGQSVFLYSICTGPHYLNMIASLDIRRALEHKGFSVFHECQFHVPPGVSTHYPAATLTQLYQAAARKALRVANELWQGTPRVAPAPLLLPIARSLLQARRAPQRPSSMDFKVQDTCSLCGTCVAACPAKNISVQDGRVRFGQTCVGCYRCVHRCPHGAITSSDSRRTLRRIARLTPTSTVLQTDQEESVLLAQSFQGSR